MQVQLSVLFSVLLEQNVWKSMDNKKQFFEQIFAHKYVGINQCLIDWFCCDK